MAGSKGWWRVEVWEVGKAQPTTIWHRWPKYRGIDRSGHGRQVKSYARFPGRREAHGWQRGGCAEEPMDGHFGLFMWSIHAGVTPPPPPKLHRPVLP
jgi:hypothetical protein